MIPLNPVLTRVAAPPIGEVRSWVSEEAAAGGEPLIDLAQALPSYPPPPALAAHLAGRLNDPQVHRYTDILGLADLRAALAEDITVGYGAGTPVAVDQVAITAGCNQAFCLAIMALAAAGDEVVLPLPYYFNHQMWLDALGVRAVHLDFRPDQGGLPDPDEAAAKVTPRTRAIVLVTPNNPTGAIYPPSLLRSFYRLAKSRGLALVVDETYRDFLPEGTCPHDLFDDPDWPQTLIHLYSFSKVFCLTGYRVGALVAGLPLLAQVDKAMDCIAICAPRIGQEAALFGLCNLGPWRRDNRALMGHRVAAFLREAADGLGGRLVSIGAYFAYLEHPFPRRDAVDVARGLAARHHLLTVPGPMFGPGQGRYLRLAFANVSTETIPTVAGRLRHACRSERD